MGINGKAHIDDARSDIRLEGGAVVVADRREIWRRAWTDKPVGADIPVRLPWLIVADPELQDRLDGLLSPETLIGRSRAQVEEDGWVDRVDFALGHAAGGVVDLRVVVEASGAYPVTRTRSVVVHVPEAQVLGPEQLADPEAVAAQVTAALRARAEGAEADTIELMEKSTLTPEGLRGYSLSEAGLVFHHRWGLPHMRQAQAPDGDVLVPWAALALAPGSPLRALAGS